MYSTWLHLYRAHVVHKQVALASPDQASPDSIYFWAGRKLLKEGDFWRHLSQSETVGMKGLHPGLLNPTAACMLTTAAT